MNRQNRRARQPPIEIPAEMLAEIKPVAPTRIVPKRHHAKTKAPVPPKQGLPT